MKHVKGIFAFNKDIRTHCKELERRKILLLKEMILNVQLAYELFV